MLSHPLIAYTVRRRHVCHAIITLGKNTQSDNIMRGMTLLPLGNTHDQTTSVMACHHCPRTAQTVVLHQALHVTIAHGQHTQSDDVNRGNAIIAFVKHTRSDYVVLYMTSWPFDSTRAQTTSVMENAIIALGMHTWSDDVGHDIPSSPLKRKHDRTTSSVACYHGPWSAYIIGLLRAWHTRMALGQHTVRLCWARHAIIAIR